ncbi:hypothetical protein QJQ45_020807 [Haematococcus lacustris]|nr:hypothetical protein QJQ45_020807 [Haematococcus lacustris]
MCITALVLKMTKRLSAALSPAPALAPRGVTKTRALRRSLLHDLNTPPTSKDHKQHNSLGGALFRDSFVPPSQRLKGPLANLHLRACNVENRVPSPMPLRTFLHRAAVSEASPELMLLQSLSLTDSSGSQSSETSALHFYQCTGCNMAEC